MGFNRVARGCEGVIRGSGGGENQVFEGCKVHFFIENDRFASERERVQIIMVL